jgi:hypothetical protein
MESTVDLPTDSKNLTYSNLHVSEDYEDGRTGQHCQEQILLTY